MGYYLFDILGRPETGRCCNYHRTSYCLQEFVASITEQAGTCGVSAPQLREHFMGCGEAIIGVTSSQLLVGGGGGAQTGERASVPASGWGLFVIEKDPWRFRGKKWGWLKTILWRIFELKISEPFVSNVNESLTIPYPHAFWKATNHLVYNQSYLPSRWGQIGVPIATSISLFI